MYYIYTFSICFRNQWKQIKDPRNSHKTELKFHEIKKVSKNPKTNPKLKINKIKNESLNDKIVILLSICFLQLNYYI